MDIESKDNLEIPLYQIIGEIAALWTLANVGYYVLLPLLGFQLSYNSAPIAIAVYFLIWLVISITHFWPIFKRHLPTKNSLWLSGLLSLGFAGLSWALLDVLAHLPNAQSALHAPYADLLLVTSWYFLPKAIEVLVQQVLITVLIFELYHRFKSLKDVIIGYAICFGGAHIILYFLNGAPTYYALIMIIASLLSSLVFPYFILRVRGGLVYTYAMHLIFYIILGIIFHLWALTGYVMR